MAKATSHLMSVIRGSVGGLNYTANQFASIVMRAKSNPTNPNTGYQGYIKNGFGYASSLWKETLSDAQRTAWNAYAQTVAYEGPNGTYYLPGRQLFIAIHSLMKYLTLHGEVFTFSNWDAPVITGNAEIIVGSPATPAIPSTCGFDINVENPGSEDIKVYAELSVPYTAQRRRFQGPFQPDTIQVIDVTAGSDDDFVFDGLNEDSVYFCRIRGILEGTPHRITPITIKRGVAIDTTP